MKSPSSFSVAIIGGGPAGLSVAKHCIEAGLTPVLFEQSSQVGGQWNAGAAHSGVWPSMRTNTSRLTTCFSDLDHPEGTAMFPTNQEIRAYLHRYAETFDVARRVRTCTRVEMISPAAGNRWCVRSVRPHGSVTTEVFDRVVVASEIGRAHV